MDQANIDRINTQRLLRGMMPLTKAQVSVRSATSPYPGTSNNWLMWFVLWNTMESAHAPMIGDPVMQAAPLGSHAFNSPAPAPSYDSGQSYDSGSSGGGYDSGGGGGDSGGGGGGD